MGIRSALTATAAAVAITATAVDLCHGFDDFSLICRLDRLDADLKQKRGRQSDRFAYRSSQVTENGRDLAVLDFQLDRIAGRLAVQGIFKW